MRITEIYVELGIKKSQDFNSCHNAVGVRGVLESGDDPEAVARQLQERCYKLLLKKMFADRNVPARAVPVARGSDCQTDHRAEATK